jgi:hypothetical protein
MDFPEGSNVKAPNRTIRFMDGSTIFIKTQGVLETAGSGLSGKSTAEIIRGLADLKMSRAL